MSRCFLEVDDLTVAELGAVLDAAERPDPPQVLAGRGFDPDEVIFAPDRAREVGMAGTVAFPVGNLAPEGSVVKATAIDPRSLDADGVYRFTGPAGTCRPCAAADRRRPRRWG